MKNGVQEDFCFYPERVGLADFQAVGSRAAVGVPCLESVYAGRKAIQYQAFRSYRYERHGIRIVFLPLPPPRLGASLNKGLQDRGTVAMAMHGLFEHDSRFEIADDPDFENQADFGLSGIPELETVDSHRQSVQAEVVAVGDSFLQHLPLKVFPLILIRFHASFDMDAYAILAYGIG